MLLQPNRLAVHTLSAYHARFRVNGGIAQRSEQAAHNCLVHGSNPCAPTNSRLDRLDSPGFCGFGGFGGGGLAGFSCLWTGKIHHFAG